MQSQVRSLGDDPQSKVHEDQSSGTQNLCKDEHSVNICNPNPLTVRWKTEIGEPF